MPSHPFAITAKGWGTLQKIRISALLTRDIRILVQSDLLLVVNGGTADLLAFGILA